ncbi:uncharacterized protein LOC128884262 [Hylaeus volcanicus]|uniref:uncharacterized protein LOC128884262 n=1 Tax=Hylaeus volcanicus TaxID=313075 RepID=UPI0023B797CB|nr:uncharacterized protein LOC128884262 [Hylaeus volcanicus]
MDETIDSTHSFQVAVDCLHDYGESMDIFVKIKIASHDNTATFHFLVNQGFMSHLVKENPSIKTSDDLESNELNGYYDAIDAVLLCGATLSEIGGLVLFMLKYPNVQVICTDATLVFSKLILYDQLIHIKTEQYFTSDFSSSQNTTSALLSTCITFPNISTVLEKVKRVAYYEHIRFPSFKDKETSSCKSNNGITIQAVPSGQIFGSCAWYITGEGEYSTALISTNLTMQPHWFFDGFDPRRLTRPLSILVTKLSSIGTTMTESMDLSEHLDKVKNKNMSSCDNNSHTPSRNLKKRTELINVALEIMQKTLENGGSVFIPVNVGLDTLILLTIFQFSFKSFFKAYPIFFLSPTGDLILNYARTMLNWMSSKVKNDFCDTRKNLFDSFPFIQFVTSVDAIPFNDTISCIVISTPSHFDSGKLFSLNAWTKMCHNPKSCILFFKEPSATDLEYTHLHNFLNFQYTQICHKSAELEIPNTTTTVHSDRTFSSFQNKTTKDDPLKDSFVSSDLLLKESNSEQVAEADEYGLLLNHELDDWADLCMPTCVHDNELFDSNHSTFPNSCVTPSTLLSSNYPSEKNAHNVHQSIEETDRLSSLFHWQTILEKLSSDNALDPQNIKTTQVQVRASRHILLGLLDHGMDDTLLNVNALTDFLLPIIFLHPKHLIILYNSINFLFFESFLHSCLKPYYPEKLSIQLCGLYKPFTVEQALLDKKLWDNLILKSFSKVNIQWNELIIDIQEDFFSNFFKDHQKSTISSDLNFTRALNTTPFCKLHHSNSVTQPKSRFSQGIISLAYVPLQLDMWPFTCGLENNIKKTKEGNSNDEKKHLELRVAPSAINTMHTVSCTGYNTILGTQSISQWILFGHTTSSMFLKCLTKHFEPHAICLLPNEIIIQNKVSIRFMHQGKYQSIYLTGGIDLATVWIKQCLHSLFQQTGSLFYAP